MPDKTVGNPNLEGKPSHCMVKNFYCPNMYTCTLVHVPTHSTQIHERNHCCLDLCLTVYLWILLVDPSCQRDCKPTTVQLGRILISRPQIDFEQICKDGIAPKIIIVILCVSLASQTLTLDRDYICVKSNLFTFLLNFHISLSLLCMLNFVVLILFPPLLSLSLSPICMLSSAVVILAYS